MTRRIIISLWLLLLLAPLTHGCIGQSATPKPIYYYTVEYDPQPIIYDTTLPWILQVVRFVASPPFNTQRIIYADKGLHRNSYGYHQWIAAPGELLPYLLMGDLRLSKGFQAVLAPDTALPATHNIHGWVEQFVELDKNDGHQAFVRLHITLVATQESNPDSRVLFQKSYQAKAPCRNETPGALAEAIARPWLRSIRPSLRIYIKNSALMTSYLKINVRVPGKARNGEKAEHTRSM